MCRDHHLMSTASATWRSIRMDDLPLGATRPRFGAFRADLCAVNSAVTKFGPDCGRVSSKGGVSWPSYFAAVGEAFFARETTHAGAER